jgi:ribosomal protein L11 methyltransferase
VSWWALDIRAGAVEHDALAAWLVERTGQAVEQQDDGTIVTFAPDGDSADELTTAIAGYDRGAAVSRRALDDHDWSVRWREGLAPRHLGRLVIVPSWIPYPPAAGEAVVVIDPETAFGSGEHGSTRAALLLLERHLQAGDRVLDLGSGSGILAIAAARLGARSAIGIEIDPEAIPVAEKNAGRNGVQDTTRFVHAEATVAPLLGPADLVLSNILRLINEGLLGEIQLALAPSGKAIFSGMQVNEAHLFRPALAQAGFMIGDEIVDDEWWAVLGVRG